MRNDDLDAAVRIDFWNRNALSAPEQGEAESD